MSHLQGFNPTVSCTGDLGSKVTVQVKQVDSTVEAGAQVQQMINLECVEDFNGESYINAAIKSIDGF